MRKRPQDREGSFERQRGLPLFNLCKAFQGEMMPVDFSKDPEPCYHCGKTDELSLVPMESGFFCLRCDTMAHKERAPVRKDDGFKHPNKRGEPERVTLGDIAEDPDPMKDAPIFFVEQGRETMPDAAGDIKSLGVRLDANKSVAAKPPIKAPESRPASDPLGVVCLILESLAKEQGTKFLLLESEPAVNLGSEEPDETVRLSPENIERLAAFLPGYQIIPPREKTNLCPTCLQLLPANHSGNCPRCGEWTEEHCFNCGIRITMTPGYQLEVKRGVWLCIHCARERLIESVEGS